MTREGNLEAHVQTLLEEVHFLLLRVYLIRSIPHHMSEAVGILLNLLGPLGDVTEILYLGIHHALGHMMLTEGFGELLPRDMSRVKVGLTEAIPQCACGAGELVGSDINTLLVGASG